MNKYFAFTILTLFSSGAWASQSEPRNWTAIIMFACVVGISLLITFKAAKKTVSKEDFYTAGNAISAKQNGLAIAETICLPQPYSVFLVWFSSKAMMVLSM